MGIIDAFIQWFAGLQPVAQAGVVTGTAAVLSALISALVASQVARSQRKTSIQGVHLKGDIDERLTVLETQLTTMAEFDKRFMEGYFAKRDEFLKQLRDLRASMFAVCERLDGVAGRALELSNREMVKRTLGVLQDSSPILRTELPSGFSQDCVDRCDDVVNELTKVILYLSDEEEHRREDGSADKWLDELRGRVSALHRAAEQFKIVSTAEESKDFVRVRAQLEKFLSFRG